MSKKVDKKATFDVLRDKLSNFLCIELKKAKDVVDIVSEMVDSELTYEANHFPSDLSEAKEKSKTKVATHSHKVKSYVKNEETMKENKSKIFTYIWVQCTGGLQETVKAEEEYKEKKKKSYVIWLLEKLKASTTGDDAKANTHDNLHEAITTFL